jgi:predicted amidohydrolase
LNRWVKIASAQLSAVPVGENDLDKKEFNFQKAVEMLSEAGAMGADIVALGEFFNVHGCSLKKDNFLDMVSGDLKRVSEQIGAIAKQFHMYIIAPVYAIIDGSFRNVALVYDRSGYEIGRYFKVHCTEEERSMGVIPGGEWPVFQLDFGAIGIILCHDNSFPESARCLAVKGAEIIFWPHVMSGWGDVFMDILMRAPAVHNGIHFVPVCYGSEPGVAWQPGTMPIGRSSIIAPDAVVIADAGRYKGIAAASIDLNQPRIAHMWTRPGEYVYRLDMLRERRPDTYGCLLHPTPEIAPLSGENIGRFQARQNELIDIVKRQSEN